MSGRKTWPCTHDPTFEPRDSMQCEELDSSHVDGNGRWQGVLLGHMLTHDDHKLYVQRAWWAPVSFSPHSSASPQD